MTERSARFALPLLVPGQAQKELYHNEALILIDAIAHAAVETVQSAPPGAPETGQGWIVEGAGSGSWAGHGDSLAVWTDGGWRFIVPAEAMTVWDKAAGFARRWDGSAWSDGGFQAARFSVGGQQVVGPRQPGVPSPSGGTTIDAEARAAVDSITVALRSHGLID